MSTLFGKIFQKYFFRFPIDNLTKVVYNDIGGKGPSKRMPASILHFKSLKCPCRHEECIKIQNFCIFIQPTKRKDRFNRNRSKLDIMLQRNPTRSKFPQAKLSNLVCQQCDKLLQESNTPFIPLSHPHNCKSTYNHNFFA